MIEAPSPFERVFNPDNSGTLTGMLGRAFGNSGAGDARGAALQELGQLLSQPGPDGQPMNPQRAVMQFMTTDSGKNFFARDPNAASTIGSFIQQMTPPQPQIGTLGPGDMRTTTEPTTVNGGGGTRTGPFNPQSPIPLQQGQTLAQPSSTPGGAATMGVGNPAPPTLVGPAQGFVPPGATQPSFTQPSERLQTQKGYVEGAGLTQEQSQGAYRDLALTPEGKIGHAIDRLVEQKVMTKEQGEAYKAGALEWKQEHNRFGTPSGWGLYDKITQKRLAAPVSDIPNAVKPSEHSDADFDLTDPKASMHLGSGALTMARDQLGRLNRMAIGNSGIDSRGSVIEGERRNSIAAVRAALDDVEKVGGLREGAAKRLLETAPELGVNVDAETNLRKMRTLHKEVTREIKSAEDTLDLTDPRNSPEVVKQASKTRDALQHVLRLLPTMKQMDQALDLCVKGDCGNFNLAGAADVLTKTAKGAKNALTGPNKVGNSFETMTPEQIQAIDVKKLDAKGRAAYRTRLDQLSPTGTPAPVQPAAVPSPAPPAPQGSMPAPVAPPVAPSPAPAGMQDRRQQGGRSPFSSLGDQPGPAFQAEGSGPSVPQFLRNPNGSTSVSPARIQQAFDVIEQAQRQGVIPSPVKKASPVRKRQPERN